MTKEIVGKIEITFTVDSSMSGFNLSVNGECNNTKYNGSFLVVEECIRDALIKLHLKYQPSDALH